MPKNKPRTHDLKIGTLDKVRGIVVRGKPIVSIIIVHYKAEKELFKCLESIYRSQTKVSYEIIVVDNDEGKTISRKLSYKFPKVLYIANSTNNGWGGGVNIGLKKAKGEYIYLLNPDTIIKFGAIDALVVFMNHQANAGVVSSTLLDTFGKPYKLQGTGNLTPLTALFAFSFLNTYFPRNPVSKEFWLLDINRQRIFSLSVTPLSSALIKKDLLEKIGGFDEDFFLYFEEYDIARRLQKLNLKSYIHPDTKVIHLWGQSTKYINNAKSEYQKSRMVYFKKYYGLVWAILVEAVLRFKLSNIFHLV